MILTIFYNEQLFGFSSCWVVSRKWKYGGLDGPVKTSGQISTKGIEKYFSLKKGDVLSALFVLREKAITSGDYIHNLNNVGNY